MMGHREPLKDGDEYDALSSRLSRRVNCFSRGRIRKIKRKFNKRVRKDARIHCKQSLLEESR